MNRSCKQERHKPSLSGLVEECVSWYPLPTWQDPSECTIQLANRRSRNFTTPFQPRVRFLAVCSPRDS